MDKAEEMMKRGLKRLREVCDNIEEEWKKEIAEKPSKSATEEGEGKGQREESHKMATSEDRVWNRELAARERRRKNIVVSGWNPPQKNLVAAMEGMLLGYTGERVEVGEVRRLEGTGEGWIKVEIKKDEGRYGILRKSWEIKGDAKVKIDKDLTIWQRETRGRIEEKYRKLKEKGLNPEGQG